MSKKYLLLVILIILGLVLICALIAHRDKENSANTALIDEIIQEEASYDISNFPEVLPVVKGGELSDVIVDDGAFAHAATYAFSSATDTLELRLTSAFANTDQLFSIRFNGKEEIFHLERARECKEGTQIESYNSIPGSEDIGEGTYEGDYSQVTLKLGDETVMLPALDSMMCEISAPELVITKFDRNYYLHPLEIDFNTKELLLGVIAAGMEYRDLNRVYTDTKLVQTVRIDLETLELVN